MKEDIYDLVIVGGGAAGFFSAIQACEQKPGLRVVILEKSNKILSKVKVSGGGRCNVTHNCFNPFQLADHYPRGEKFLKKIFKQFQASDMVRWLKEKGVQLKTEEDGRMFPITNDSGTIIECFLKEASKHGVSIKLNTAVEGILPRSGERLTIVCSNGQSYRSFNVLICTGGNAKAESYDWLKNCGHEILPPIPSLFTFNDPEKTFSDLMGISVASAEVRITGSKIHGRGALLITHWGLSGPVVIRLSAWAAAYLHEKNYHFGIQINWTSLSKEDEVKEVLAATKQERPKQKVHNYCPFSLPSRLWERICVLSLIEPERTWGETSNRNLNKLLENLYRCAFSIKGKTTFKEEFVTCGGIDLNEINPETMESYKMPGLFFAGEVLNIDGETGGFNFQAAWSTGFIAAKFISANTPAAADRQQEL